MLILTEEHVLIFLLALIFVAELSGEGGSQPGMRSRTMMTWMIMISFIANSVFKYCNAISK